MNFCIHTRNPFCFVSQEGSGTCNYLHTIVTFSNKLRTNQSVFHLTTGDHVYWCRGKSNPCYFIWYHFKIVFAIILLFEILIRKSALKICMILQKSEWLASVLKQAENDQHGFQNTYGFSMTRVICT